MPARAANGAVVAAATTQRARGSMKLREVVTVARLQPGNPEIGQSRDIKGFQGMQKGGRV